MVIISEEFKTDKSPEYIFKKVKTYHGIPEKNRPKNSDVHKNNWMISYGIDHLEIMIEAKKSDVVDKTIVKVSGKDYSNKNGKKTKEAIDEIVSDLKGDLGIQGGRRTRKRRHRKTKSRRSRK